MRRLDVGIASFRKTDRLRTTLESLIQHSTTDWRCFVVDNASGPETRGIISEFAARDGRIIPVFLDVNVGYAGAVNKIFELAETEYIAYLDDDTEIHTAGWDEHLCSYLDRYHELGIVFPNWGHSAIPRGAYHEVLWAAGFAWVVSRMAQRTVGPMDTEIGHHEEVDFATRLKLQGYKLACAPEIRVSHHETATRSPESQERISQGVVRWMNKWVGYFCGKDLNYHSPNVLRITDWPVHALHMEDYFKAKLPDLNVNPETVEIDGAEWDLIRVPRPKGFYRSRII